MARSISEDEQQFMNLLVKISKERREELERMVYRSARYQIYACVSAFSKQYGVEVSLTIHDEEEGNA